MHFQSPTTCMLNLKSLVEKVKNIQLSRFLNMNVLRSDTSVDVAIPPTQTPEKDEAGHLQSPI